MNAFSTSIQHDGGLEYFGFYFGFQSQVLSVIIQKLVAGISTS